MKATTHMTGAELQTLREALHMDRADLADLAGVAARTVKHWENGRAGVPADVAALVADLDRLADAGAAALVHSLMVYHALQAAPAPLVLVRFQAVDYPPGLRDFHQACGLDADTVATLTGPHLATHCAATARARQILARHTGQAPRVVWFDADAWHAWRLDHAGAPSWAWAQGMVALQAIPHRGDQPPAPTTPTPARP